MQKIDKTTTQLENEIKKLKLENDQLKRQAKLLKLKIYLAEKKCACYRNNQKMCEENT